MEPGKDADCFTGHAIMIDGGKVDRDKPWFGDGPPCPVPLRWTDRCGRGDVRVHCSARLD
jgi:hypothetical protein